MDTENVSDHCSVESTSSATQHEQMLSNPLDINGPKFDCEAYLSQLLKQKSLQQLLDTEHGMVQEVRRLDSDMQTLVYENYNKFITATDTIRKMKSDFVKMEDQMDQLAQKMTRITDFSEHVSGALSGQRENIQTLARANRTLKNLEFIFELPSTLQGYVDKKEYSLAVNSYLRARAILHQYKDEPSFKGIYSECEVIVEELREQLKEQFTSRIASTKEVASAVNQLILLGDPSENLAEEFLESAETHLTQELQELRVQIALKSDHPLQQQEKLVRPADAIPNLPMDVLEFVDSGCSSFLGNLSLVVQTFTDMFLKKEFDGETNSVSQEKKEVSEALGKRLVQFITRLMTVCFELAERRFLQESDPSESSIVVRALDRFYRRLQATSKLLPDINYAESSLAILLRVAEHEEEMSYNYLHQNLDSQVKETRQQLAASHKTLLAPATSGKSESHQLLSEILTKLEQTTVHNLKTALANLLQFTAYDVTFASKARFLMTFGRMVRENLVVKFFHRIVDMGNEFCEGRGDKAYVNATLILLLSRFAKNLESSTAGYILDLCEQQFRLGSVGDEDQRAKVKSLLTPSSLVTGNLGEVSQKLLDHYVEMEGFALSQLLVKSVETRDWLGCVEPRAVRAVMKRVVEDLTAIDARVGQLFEEGSRKDRSSDSSRRTPGISLASRPGKPSAPPLGDTALSNTLGKLWTERIDYFSSVEFTKVSVLTGIVKICLKTLLESVRLRTFGTYGLQQVQVDCHYLQLYLWRFVSDEHLIHCLLDEVVSSAVHRCTEPQLMEPSVVEVICERG